MSEYNRDTGILRLTLEDAHRFHRTQDRRLGEAPPMSFYADKLTGFGHKVTIVTEQYLDVEATQDEVWELLAGQHTYL